MSDRTIFEAGLFAFVLLAAGLFYTVYETSRMYRDHGKKTK